MIKRLTFRNFKSIGEQVYDFTPFDLLVGRNNSGKSTVLQALAIGHSRSGEDVMLMRCNGNDHLHPNRLEGEAIRDQCHVHLATERYILAGLRVEGYAQPSENYQTLDGALHELAHRANISGLKTEADAKPLPGLF
jgi:predicted ATPase